MLQAGLPMPKQQAEIYDEHGVLVARVDFLWEDYGLIGEVDGAVKYGRLLPAGQTAQQAVLAEKEREGKLRRLGYWIARWDWDTALNRAKLADVVGSGLATAPGRVNRGFVAVPQG